MFTNYNPRHRQSRMFGTKAESFGNLDKVTTTQHRPKCRSTTKTKMAICSALLQLTSSSSLTCFTTVSKAWSRSFHASASTSMAKRWKQKTEVPFQSELKNPGSINCFYTVHLHAKLNMILSSCMLRLSAHYSVKSIDFTP